MSNFVHLNCHSEYSIVDGILRLKPLITKTAAYGMTAIALTDQSNLFAMVKFYKIARTMKVKPIIGCDVWLDHGEQRLTLLCQNNVGLTNLMQLVSKSYNNWQQDKPIVNKDWFYKEKLHIGLIAIAPMLDSDVGQLIVQNNLLKAKTLAYEWLQLFGDRFYLAVTRVGNSIEEYVIQQILAIAQQDIPIVATGEVRFLERDDFTAHEARVCINQGVRLDDEKRKKIYVEQQYLKSSNDMATLFADLPESLLNSVEIAKRCNVQIELGKTYLPKYKTPNNVDDQQYLILTAKNGLIARLNCNSYSELPEKYVKRLEVEISVINSMGFAGYFLIVADIIQWSIKEGIPVGPGRGSGAGSLVAYALQITNIDPLNYNLLFERFLNPERVSMPDFDIDFCINGRDLVIEYVANKYGQDSVAQIITYGTMAAKAAIRDVGRVLGSPYGFVDQIAKLIPLELGITIDQALEQEIILKNKYNEDDEVKAIIDLAKKLEGIIRNVGKHAGGLVIAPNTIINFSPLYREANCAPPVTQFDKNDIEDLGLVKFDFLGLKTLTIIDWAVTAINNNLKATNKVVNINNIPIDDQKTFEFLAKGNTTAVFQLESRGMRELTVKLQPSHFEDLIAIGALYRPGPLQSGMVDDFINRKQGREVIQYLHPKLAPILKTTYGVVVYQEQVMQIAQVLAGYTLGAADLLRRAMGKKKPEEMAKQREIFVRGANVNGLSLEQAGNIFDLMENFSGYGFNKSHAAGYALITYQTAWLKTHYPAEFMASVLSLELGNTDKIIVFITECKKMNIKILSPNINKCEYKFVATNNNTVNYGLGAIKGVGAMAVNNIMFAKEHGEFKNLLDLCKRVDLHKVSRKTLEALIKAGALDCFNLSRGELLNCLDKAIKIAQKLQQSCGKQLNLFDDLESDQNQVELNFGADLAVVWSKKELLSAEKEALGFYFSDHPLIEYQQELIDLGVIKFNQAQVNRGQQRFAGLIADLRLTRTKSGDKMAFVTLDDAITRQEIIIFSDLYSQNKDLLKKDQLVIIEGDVSLDHYTGGFKIRCSKFLDLYDLREKFANSLTIILNEISIKNNDTVDMVEQIKQLIKNYPGNCPLIVHYKKENILTKVKFGIDWMVCPKEKLLTELKNLSIIEDAYIDF